MLGVERGDHLSLGARLGILMFSAMTSPRKTLPSASLPPIAHNAPHEPMSFQPMLTGTKVARFIRLADWLVVAGSRDA